MLGKAVVAFLIFALGAATGAITWLVKTIFGEKTAGTLFSEVGVPLLYLVSIVFMVFGLLFYIWFLKRPRR